jgi:hypothetical protein
VSSIETILHALFLPTPFKSLQALGANTPTEGVPAEEGVAQRRTVPGEVLKPGALYAECAVVPLRVPPAPPPPETDGAPVEERKEERGAEAADDGEMGGVALGSLVWDEFERELKEWEAEHATRVMESERRDREEQGRGREGSTPPTVDKELPTVDDGV